MADGCALCNTMPPGDLVELDLLMADPMRWPVTIWKGFAPPENALPASYRRFGAMNMGTTWLDSHGYSFTMQQVRKHLRYDVPVLSVSVDDLIGRGIVAQSTERNSRPGHSTDAIDPLAYIRLYNKGISLGLKGLELLSARVQALIDKGEDVPLPLVKMIVDAGLKLAQSQASIKAAGRNFGDEGGEENEAFRGAGEISPRLGHQRVRRIEGEMRPVTDDGLADRTRYNERAAQEGGIRIGGR